jgi:hypothetical protein
VSLPARLLFAIINNPRNPRGQAKGRMNLKKLLVGAILLACGTASAATAFWTGRSEMVQTVTYRMAWKCEYQVYGNTFWVVIEGSLCPMTMEVK